MAITAIKTSAQFIPESIGSLVEVGSPALSPDGRRVVYVVTRVDQENNSYQRSLWIAHTDGSESPRQLTSGEFNDGQPTWSPLGDAIVFVSSGRSSDPARPHSLHRMPVDGPGEITSMARRDEGFEAITWSPDGSRLAFVSRDRDGVPLGVDDASVPARKIAGLRSRTDGAGWTVGRPRRVYVMDSDGWSSPQAVTSGLAEAHAPAWSPDGTALSFVSARHEHADLDNVDDVWVVEVDELGAVGVPAQVTQTDAVYMLPSWSKDGLLAYYRSAGPNGRRRGHRHSQVAIRDLREDSASVLTERVNLHLTPGCARAPIWRESGMLVAAEEKGSVILLNVSRDGDIERVVDAFSTVTGYDANDDTVVFTATSTSNPPELYALRGGVEQQLTHHQAEFLRQHPALPTTRFSVTSEDGCLVDAWMVLPAGVDQNAVASVPMVLSIHGGPQAQYGERWFDEFQLLASAGFAVLFANPHGSTGGSEHFARAILSPIAPEDPGTGWGELDYRDLMAVVDKALVRFPTIDAARLGVLGGSYGGFMTSWIVTQNQRFRAACSERAVNNLLSLEWSSDLAGHFHLGTGADAQLNPEELIRMSPVTYSTQIETPLLILHAENDMRCPIEQADSLFIPLHRRGHHVEYWRFPGEGHEMSRSGSPSHRIQRAEIVNEWFTRMLNPPTDTAESAEVSRDARQQPLPKK